MLTLADLQSAFGRSLIADPSPALLTLIPGDGIEASARLAIYRNNVVTRLTDALRGAYPVVRRIVEPRFFDFAALEYIRRALPVAGSLGQYGESFPEFLEYFPPTSHLGYLPDVAQLEWCIHAARRAAHPHSLPIAAIADLSSDPAQLRLSISPCARYLYARHGVDRLWAAHQAAEDPDHMTLEEGDVHLQVTLIGALNIGRLARSAWTFRRALQTGGPLGLAVEHAMVESRRFDPASEIAALFGEGLVIGVEEGPAPETREMISLRQPTCP